MCSSAGRGQSPVALVLARMPAQVGMTWCSSSSRFGEPGPCPASWCGLPGAATLCPWKAELWQNEARGDPRRFLRGLEPGAPPLLFAALVFGRGLARCPLVSFCLCQGPRLVTEGIVIMVKSHHRSLTVGYLLTGPCGNKSSPLSLAAVPGTSTHVSVL